MKPYRYIAYQVHLIPAKQRHWLLAAFYTGHPVAYFVSGDLRAWYRSVFRVRFGRVHTCISSWGLFFVQKLTCLKREEIES